MIVQLTGTLVELTASHVVLDVGGVGYELGVSAVTAGSLPEVGTPGVTLLARLIVREDSMTLFGFSTREERSLFDRLCAISGVGPKLALSVLSTFTPAQLAGVVAAEDAGMMATVPGVGKKLASRLLLRRDDGHGLFLRERVEVAAEVDGDALDVHAEQIVRLVLEHERRQELIGDAGYGRALLHAFDLMVRQHAVLHERVHEIDAFLGVHAQHLHEARAFRLLFRCKRRQALDGERDEFRLQGHVSHAPFFCACRAFDFSSRIPSPCTTASMMASGRTAQPGAYTSTGMAWSTPPITL